MTEAWFIRGAERVIPPGHNSPEKWYFFNNLKYVDITVVKNMVKLLFNIVLEVLGCKINAQKSGVLLYTNNESEEKEMKELIPFTIAPKTIRYLGINLTKDLYSENYKTLRNEIRENIKKWKNIPCSWI